MSQIRKISNIDIKEILKHAAISARKRTPILLNESYTEVPQRFINCLAKNAYIRPHKHPYSYQIEQFSIIYGEATVLIFDDNGVVTERFTLGYNHTVLVEIPCNVYHTVFTDTGCAFLEVRNHAYIQERDKEFAAWSPEENSSLVETYYETLTKIQKGEICVIK